MAKRQQLTIRANQAGTCFVLNEYNDDPDASAYMVDLNMRLPTETTEQIPLTPTVSTAVMLHGVVLRDSPKQVVSLTKAKSVPTNMREFLSWAQRRYRIDVTASAVERKTGGLTSGRTCPGGCKEFFHKDSNAHSIRLTCKICGTVRKEERQPQRQDPATCSHRHTDHRGSNANTRKTYCVDCGTYIDTVPREIFNALEATRSASSNRNEELTDRETRDTTITKQHIDLATRMMLDQVSRLSDGDYGQSMVIQLFLDCVYRATASSTAFASFREEPMNFNDNQTLSLQVVDPIADERVWANFDDGRNSCCHVKSGDKMLKQN